MGSQLHPLSDPEKYYVDGESCLSCNSCDEEAPNNIAFDMKESAYVYKQPSTPEEEAAVKSAMRYCAPEAIHDDGDVLE